MRKVRQSGDWVWVLADWRVRIQKSVRSVGGASVWMAKFTDSLKTHTVDHKKIFWWFGSLEECSLSRKTAKIKTVLTQCFCLKTV